MKDKINAKLDEEYKWLQDTPYSKNVVPDIIDILKDKCIANNAALRRALECIGQREDADWDTAEGDIAKILQCKQ